MTQTIDAIVGDAGDSADVPQRRSGPPQNLARLWPRKRLVAAAVVVGAVMGFALTNGPTVYQSAAIVQLSESTQDSNRVKQVAQTVERTATSDPVIEGAAEARAEDPTDLGRRVTALWETDTDVVTITVRGTDPDAVADDADAVVRSLQEFYDRRTRAEIEELSTQGDELLSTGRLQERSAEAARRSGVGAALAARQGDAAAGWTTVTPLGSASSPTPTGLSRPIAIALGGFVGGVLGAVAAILLPFRRRRVGRAEEVSVLLPGTRGIAPGDGGASELAGLFLESECTDLAIIGLGDIDADALYFASDVTILLRAHGKRATIMDATDSSAAKTLEPAGAKGADGDRDSDRGSDLASYQFLGRTGRREARDRHHAQTLIVVTSARTETVSLLAGQAELMAVVAVRAGKRRTDEVKDLLDQLRPSHPIVVLLQ